MLAKFIILSRKKFVKMFLEKLALGIDLAMAEGKSVILAGDYNLNYFAKRDRSRLQSVISPYDLKHRLHHNRRLRNRHSSRYNFKN